MLKLIPFLTIAFTLTACSTQTAGKTVDLMKEIKKDKISPTESTSKAKEITDLSLEILRDLDLKDNTMISPISIASALPMTANGAKNETLAQMEHVLGSDMDSLNSYLYSYREALPVSEKYKVSLANSIWLRNDPDLEVKQDFLQKNKDYYDADVFKAKFDENTKNEINQWVSDKTEKQIEKLLEQAPSNETVMYLINALSFDGEWEEPYTENMLKDGEFVKADQEKQTVKFMNSEEYGYISLPNAEGVEKPYADGNYSFVALLPEEGISMPDFLNSLSGEKLQNALQNATGEKVMTSIPKFEFDYDILLNDTLKKLGMTDAFSPDLADFNAMAVSKNGNIYISRVIHKTKIAVDEKGTKAGAVTAVEMMAKCALDPREPKRISFDRPFLFMIIDTDQGVPLFMGILNEV